MRKLISLGIFILAASSSVAGQGTRNVATFSAADGAHKAKIVLATRPFVRKQHRIKQISDEKKGIYGTWIDGRYALGTDSGIPRREIAYIKFYFDGKEVPVKNDMFSDCYDPNLETDYFWLKLGDDKKSVMALMAGSDAAGSYQVFWIFRSDGRHSRFSNHVSDGNVFEFAKWFFDK